eukprot:293669_1
MGEINRNIDLMELGVASDTFASAEKRNKKRKEWEKMNTISSEWQRLRKEETLEEQKEEKASECDDMCCNDTAKCGSRKRIQLVMRCYRRNFLNRFDYHAMDHATDDAHDDMQYIEVFEHALDRYNATDLLNDYFHIERCHGGEKELRDCVHNGADDGDDEDIVCCSLLWRAERDSNDSKIFAEYLKTLDSRQINILDISSKIHRFLNHYSPQQQTDSCVRALTRRYKASKHNKFVNEIDGEADTRQQAVEPMLCIDDQLVRDLRANGLSIMRCNHLMNELVDNEYDSDAIIDDLSNENDRCNHYEDSQIYNSFLSQSNKYFIKIIKKRCGMKPNDDDKVTTFVLGRYRVMYWKYWKGKCDKNKLYADSPKYRSLKEECIHNEIYSIDIGTFHDILQKAVTYTLSNKGRSLKAKDISLENLGYEIPINLPIS